MSSRVTLIVGSGVAAVAVARRLLNRSSSEQVLILEAGPDFEASNYRMWVDFVMTKETPTRKFVDLLCDVDANKDGGYVLPGGRLIVKGGSTNHWGGWCPRMKPEDFRLGDVRKKAINWAVGYDELAPYYTESEHFLDVCGDSTTVTAPRYGALYKHRAIPFTAMDHLLIPTLQKLGANSYEALPLARNAPLCVTTGTCRYCPTTARYSAANDVEKLKDEFGERVKVRTNTPVLSLVMRNKKTAAGVRCRDKLTGDISIIESDRVVIAAGTIETAKLLMLSTSADWPNGVGNDTDHVGRHLVTHPLMRAVARIDKNIDRLEQELDFPTMASRLYDVPEYQKTGKMYFARDGRYVLGERDLSGQLIKGVSVSSINKDIVDNTLIELRGLVEAFPGEGNRVSLLNGFTAQGLPKTKIQYTEDPDTKQVRSDHLGRLESILFSAGLKEFPRRDSSGARSDHSIATCRMSNSAVEGVVDRNLQVHDTDNVFVCSNAVFPNAGAVNPTLTLVALALRLGDRLGSA